MCNISAKELCFFPLDYIDLYTVFVVLSMLTQYLCETFLVACSFAGLSPRLDRRSKVYIYVEADRR